MSIQIAIVCGSFHKDEVGRMLAFAKSAAAENNLEVVEVLWVPGCMEIPLAIDRVLSREDISAASCLGIIEKGETQHGLVIGQAIVKTILELQLEYDKPIGLGIIGPGAAPEHVEPRLVSHARGAIDAIAAVL